MTKLSYTEWMKAVDIEIGKFCGLTSDDLADCCYRDMYDDGYSVEEAATTALESNSE